MCAKLGRELPGLDYPPFEGELGVRIWRSVSQEAWNLFLEHFKMVLNEYRLAGGTDVASNVFFDQAEKFLFAGGASTPPPDYVAPRG